MPGSDLLGHLIALPLARQSYNPLLFSPPYNIRQYRTVCHFRCYCMSLDTCHPIPDVTKIQMHQADSSKCNFDSPSRLQMTFPLPQLSTHFLSFHSIIRNSHAHVRPPSSAELCLTDRMILFIFSGNFSTYANGSAQSCIFGPPIN